jgi:type VI secretion system protein ImpB
MAIQDLIPKSRLTLRYHTEISGQPEDIELPLRVLIAGDFSGSSTKKLPFEARKILSFDGKNLNAVMERMKIRLNVTDSSEDTHTINVESVDAFLPSHLIESIDSINDLVKAKKLLNGLMSSINNSNKFRNAINQLVSDAGSLDSLKALLAPSYESQTTLPESLNTTEAAA